MRDIYFYEDKRGRQPVREYIEKLSDKNDKDSRIKLNKIRDYIKVLCESGLGAGEPFIKHITGELWELRPLRDRIFFVSWQGDSFILLHYFMKQSQQTPEKEIKQALRNLKDFKERLDDGQK